MHEARATGAVKVYFLEQLLVTCTGIVIKSAFLLDLQFIAVISVALLVPFGVAVPLPHLKWFFEFIGELFVTVATDFLLA